MPKQIIFLVIVFLSTIFISCDWLTSANNNSGGNGNIFVAVSLEGVNTTATRATAHTKLILRLLDDSENIIKDTSITTNKGVEFCNMGKIPAETDCKLIAWTEDVAGIVIHSPDTQSIVVEPNANSSVILSLQPRVGSIVAQFAGVLNTIDSFFMSFDSDSGFFETRVPRAVNTYLTLDNVPYGAKGNLSLKITKKDQSFLVEWDTLFTFKRENISLEFSFLSNGAVSMSVSLDNPYNTIITGIGDPNADFSQEINKGIVITEFSFNYGNNRNFVEIANLSDEEQYFDELTVEVIGSSKTSATAKNITLLPQETAVFANNGAKDFWEPQGVSIFGTMNLVSTASIIMLKGDGELLDYIMYTNDNASTWVKPSTRTSLYLAEKNGNPKFNNIPANWNISTDTIMDGSTIYYGNPGKL